VVLLLLLLLVQLLLTHARCPLPTPFAPSASVSLFTLSTTGHA
jgi:hypothetical protein